MDKSSFQKVAVVNDDSPASPSTDMLSSVSPASLVASQKKSLFIRLM